MLPMDPNKCNRKKCVIEPEITLICFQKLSAPESITHVLNIPPASTQNTFNRNQESIIS